MKQKGSVASAGADYSYQAKGEARSVALRIPGELRLTEAVFAIHLMIEPTTPGR